MNQTTLQLIERGRAMRGVAQSAVFAIRSEVEALRESVGEQFNTVDGHRMAMQHDTACRELLKVAKRLEDQL